MKIPLFERIVHIVFYIGGIALLITAYYSSRNYVRIILALCGIGVMLFARIDALNKKKQMIEEAEKKHD